MTTSSHVVCAFCEIPAGDGHHDLCPQARGHITVHGQTDEPRQPNQLLPGVHP